jgi:hypothetical protein
MQRASYPVGRISSRIAGPTTMPLRPWNSFLEIASGERDNHVWSL